MFRVVFSAKVRNRATEESWRGFYNPVRPHELRSDIASVPKFDYSTREQALAFIAEILPDVSPLDLTQPDRERFTAPTEWDEESGEHWTRSANLTEV